MAKQVLPVNFTDDLLAESMDGKRKYRIIDNGDGTVSLEDVSEYLQTGSAFGAGQINSTNQAVNESVDKDKILKTLEEVSASTDSDAVVGRGAVAELNQNMTNHITVNTNAFAGYPLATAIGKLLASFAEVGTYSGRFKTSDGWYTIHCFYAGDSGKNSGYVSDIADASKAYVFSGSAGADAVLKKLGEPTITTGGNSSSYTIPSDGKAIIFYTASFYNREGATHSGNMGSYTIKLGNTTINSGSASTPNSKNGFGFNDMWVGDVKKGQVVTLTTSAGGWMTATNVHIRVAMLT